MAKILIVDDNELDRLFLAALVKKCVGRPCVFANNGHEAIAEVKNDRNQEIAAVLLDMSMPGLNGRDALPQLLMLRPGLQVIAVTGLGEPKTVVDIIRMGAADYLLKPVDPDLFNNALIKAMEIFELRSEIKQLSHKDKTDVGFGNLIGDSLAMQTCVKLGQRAASSDITVLITGESGTGKEMLARSIHAASARANKPFIAINCGALPKDLVESTLFGHKRGSFTGAFTDAKGKFLEADGGTLFLDEIGELPLDAQVKLLRVLQQNEIEPIGAGKSVPVNVRILAATNRNPYLAVQRGHMREDLFYRLNVFPIQMPPLRQRIEDIDALSDFFLQRYAAAEGKTIKRFDHDAAAWMVSHNWPGNVRELENAIYRAVLLCDHDRIRLDHLLYSQSMPASDTPTYQSKQTSGKFQLELLDIAGEFKTINQIMGEIENIALSHYKNDVALAARQLGIGKSTLYKHRQIKK